MGRNDSWDLRNYHRYDAYAVLHDRLWFDVAVAHHATYVNPLLDLPVWWLGHALPGWLVAAVLGAMQGLNGTLLYLVARDSLAADVPRRRAIAVALALVGSTGAYAVTLTGSVHHDNTISIGVLAALWLVVSRGTTLAGGEWRAAWPVAAMAGFLVGVVTGAKLPGAPYALGIAAALTIVGGSARRRASLVFVAGLAGLAGLLLAAGWWYWRLWHDTGNPLFPYFNDVFQSPLLLDASYRDDRFLPRSLLDALMFPFRAALDWRVSADWPVTDWRIACAYVAVIVGAITMAARRFTAQALVPPRTATVLFAFAIATWASWLPVFAIYRYIVALEMLAPLLVLAGIGLLPIARASRLVVVTVVLALAILATRWSLPARTPFTPAMIEVQVPRIAEPSRTMVLMTGVEAFAYVIPSFPPEIPFLRIDGWLAGPGDGSGLSRDMQRRIVEHVAAGGDLYVLFDEREADRNGQALSKLGLWRGMSCEALTANLSSTLRWCSVETISAAR